MAIKFLRTSKIENKTVLVRGSVDASVDLAKGQVSDDFRLRSFLPTVEFLRAAGNKVIICGKMKRAKGKVVPEFSLKPAAEKMADLMGLKFIITDGQVPDYGINHFIFYNGDIREEKNIEQIKKISPKDIVFLENLEYYPEELADDREFSKKLASLAEVYV